MDQMVSRMKRLFSPEGEFFASAGIVILLLAGVKDNVNS